MAGFYGFSDSAAKGNFEHGRLKYLHQTTCSQSSGRNESFIQSFDNTSIFAPSCAIVSGSSTVQNFSTSSILGQRYIHQTTCLFAGGEKEIFTQSVDNSSTFTPSCSGLTGSSLDSSATLDLFGQRYLHQTICTQSSGEKEIFTQSVDKNPIFTPSCATLSGSTLSNSSTIDLLDSSNASGYVEYQMKSNTVEDYKSALNVDIGDYGFNVISTSTSFVTVTDIMANSLSLKVFCDLISPLGGERNLSLSDAELRAGQDFRCNYLASICPIVFDDVNTNGKYDALIDALTSGVLVQLQSLDGLVTYSSITTGITTQCFPNLLHGRTYKVNIPVSPTGTSTTGGNFKNQTISYKDTAKNVEFGFSNGFLILNVPASVDLPQIVVASKPQDTSTTINPIQVIDTRSANPGWTLTATVADFTSKAITGAVLPVANAFKNTPGSITINNGQSNGISIGDLRIVTSTADIMNIFNGSVGNSKGDYQISTNITLTVPSLSRATTYQTLYTYTII